jgi:hypothetical protein
MFNAGAGGTTVDLAGAVVLGSNVSINTNGGTGNNLTFGGTINADNSVTNNRTLTIDSTGATVRFNGNIGNNVNGRLAGLSVTASSIIIAGATVRLDDDDAAGASTFTGAVTLENNVVIDLGDNNLTFASTVDSDGTTRDLTLNADAGNLTFSGAVGGTAALDALALNSTGTTTLTAAVTAGSLATNAGGTTAINGGAVTTTGAQTYNDNVTLGANTALSATTTTFNGTVAGGGFNLGLTGNAVFGDATTDTVTGLGTLAVSGTTTINTATVTSAGTQTYNGAVTLGADTTLTTTDSTVLFSSTVDSTGGARDLTVSAGTGAITFTGAVGGTAALDALALNSTGTTTLTAAVTAGSLATNAGGTTAINGGAVTTTGAQTYNDNVTLGANTALSATTTTFNGTVAGGGFNLGLTGNAVLGDATTDTVTGLGTLAVSGTTTINTATVTSAGTQTYNGAVTLGADTTLTTTDSTVLFSSTVDSTGGARDLTVSAGTGAITFTGAVGGTAALDALALNSTGTTTLTAAVTAGSLATNAGGTTAINGGAVTTTGAQTYNDNVTLGANTALSATTTTFNGTVAGGGFNLGLTGNAVLGDATTDTVTGLGTLAVSGTTTINTATVTSAGTQTYNGAVTLGADTTLTTTDSTVLFSSTVDSTGGARDLTVSAGTGAITFTGAVGGTAALDALALNSTGTTTLTAAVTAGSLATNAGGTTAINGGAVTTTGAQTYNDNVTLGANTALSATTTTFNGTVAGGGFNLGLTGNAVLGDATTDTVTGLGTLAVSGTTTINTATVTSAGTQTYNGAVTLGADTTLTTTDSTVLFSSTVDSTGGARDLTVSAGTGAITFTGAVGGTAALDALALNSTGTTTLTAAVTAGSLATNAGGTTAINGGAVTTTGAQTYNDNVTLGANTALSATTTTFNGTVAGGGFNLGLTGNAVFGDATTDTVTGLGTLAVSGTTTINTATVTSAGTQTYNGAVTLGADTTLTTTDSTVLFSSTVDSTGGARDLTVSAGTGAITFTGAVGGTAALDALALNSTGTTTLTAAVTAGSLATNAGGTTAINGGAVTTTGAQTYNDNVTLGANTALSATTTTFNGTVAGGGFNLGLTGNAVFGDATTDTVTGLGTLAVSGTTTINTATVTSAGTQTYNGAVTLGADTTLTTTDSTVLFSSTVDSTGGARDLTVSAGTGAITFTGAVGGTAALDALALNSTGTTTLTAAVTAGSLATNAGGTTAINGGAVTTTGAQTYNDNVTLGANTALSATTTTFNGTVAGGGFNLGLTGNAVLGDATTDTVTGLGTLAVSGTTTINTATVTSAGTQTYNGAVTLGADTTLTTTDSTVLFSSTVDSTGGARDLTVSAGTGAITFTGAVGGTAALDALALNSTGTTTLTAAVTAGSLATNAGGTTAINGGAVTTTGAQTYNDNVTLGANTALSATTTTFNGTVAGGGFNLGLTGNAVFGDATTDTVTGLGTLAVSGTTTINTATVTSAGTQTYNGAVTLGADTTLTTTDSTVLFSSTVDSTGGARDLTVSAGTGAITFTGAVGGTAALDALALNSTGTTTLTAAVTAGSLATNAGGTTAINGGAVTTTGAQTYNDNVTLGANTALSATTTTFNGTVAGGGFNLGLTGNAVFGDATTDTVTGLGTLAVSGTTTINTATVTSAGTQTYNGAVTLGADTTLTTTDSTVLFSSTVDSTGGARDLTVSAGTGAITFTGAVGGTAALDALALNSTGTTTLTAAVTAGSLATNAGGTTAINGGAVTTTGAQTYNDNVTLGANTALSATTTTFNGTVAGGGFNLGLTGNAVLGDATTDTVTGLGTLAVSGTTTINTATVTSAGTQTYNGAVTLGADTTLTTTDSTVLFSSTVDSTGGARDLTVSAGTGAITFTGAVGGTAALDALALNSTGTTTLTAAVTAGSLATNAGGTTAINGGAVTTTGAQTYNDNVTLGANTALSATTTTFNGTVAGGGFNLGLTGNAVLGDATTDTVTGLGTLAVSGTTTINTATVTSAGTQTYNGAVTLGADTTLTTTDSTVLFSSTVDSTGGARDLTVSAGTGAITFTGAVGGTAALDALALNSTGTTTLTAAVTAGSLATNAGGTTAINGGAVTTTGAQTYNDNVTLGANTALSATTTTFNGTVAGGGFNLGLTGNAVFGDATTDTVTGLGTLAVSGTTTINTATVTSAGTQTYNGAVTLGADTTLTTTDSTVLFSSTVDSTGGARDLTVSAGTGAITFTGAVGGTAALDALALNSTGTTTLTAAVTAGSLATNAGGTTAINGGAVTTTGAQTYNDNVTLGANTALSATTTTFNGTVAGGGFNLGLTGNAVFGDATTDTVTGLGTLAVSGTTTINTATVTSAGTQTYNGAVTLGADTTLTTTDSTVLFSSTVDSTGGARDLTVSAGTGAITFTGAVGGTAALDALALNSTGTTTLTAAVTAGSLATNAGGTTAINGGAVTTTGAQTYNDNVTLGANTALSATTTTFNGTVAGGGFNLGLTGNAVLGDATTDTVTGLGTLAVSGTTTINTATVTSAGTQTYNGAVTLGADTTLTTTDSTVLFSSTVDSTGGARDLTVSAGTGAITFTGAVGGTAALDALALNSTGTTTLTAAVTAGSLATNAGGTTAINGGAVTTTGAQTYNDNVTLGANTALSATTTTFNGTVAGGGFNLGLTGNAVFGDATTDTVTGLGTLAVSGTTTINTATVTSAGTQTYNGAVTLGADTTLTTTDSTVLFSSTVDSTGGARDLTVSAGTGAITFTGAVGGTAALDALALNSTGTTTLTAAVTAGSLATNAGGTTAINGGAVTTTGAQTYNDNVTLGANTALSATTTTFNGTVAGGGFNLGLTGNAVFGDATTDTVTGLGTLAVSGTTTINTATVTSAGTQTYNGAVTLGADTTLTTTDSTVLFSSTVDSTGGARDLTVSAGTGAITFTGAVGGTAALDALALNSTGTTTLTAAVTAGSLATNAGGTTAINGGAVTTTGAQTYNDNVTLGANTALSATTTTFNGTVAGGGFNLGLTGNAVLGDATTDTVTGLGTLAVSGTTTINTATVTSAGTQTYNGAVTLGADTTLTTTDSTVLFSSTVDSTGGARDLTVSAGTGAITFTGAVGGTAALDALALNSTGTTTLTAAVTAGSLATNAGGTTAINGGAVTTTGAQTYNDNVTLGANTALSATTTTFNGTVAGGGFNLGLTGNAVLGDATTDTVTGLGTLAVSGTTTINTATVTSAGTQTYNGAVTLGADTTLTTTDSTVLFSSTVDSTGGARDLTVSAGTGAITFTGAVGQVARLGDVTITSANNVTISAAFSATTLAQLAGTGTTTVNGITDTNAVGGISLTGNVQIVNANLTTTTGGPVTFTNAGLLTLNANVISDGAVTQNGAGAVAITGSRTITTTSDTVDFLRAVTLNGAGATMVINTTTAGTGGSITFQNTLNATTAGATAEDLTLTAGTTGNITFMGNVGATRLGDVTINSGNAVAFQDTGTQQAASLTVTASTSTTFAGNLNLTNGVSLAAGAGNVAFLDGLTAGAASSFANTGALQLGDAATDVTSLTGALTHTAGVTSLGGTVTAPTGATLAVATVNADTVLNTTNSAVAFNSTLDSDALETNDLTVNTGTAATTISGVIGGTPNGELGTLTINNTSASGMALPSTNALAVNVTTNGPVTDFGNLAITGLLAINAGTNDVTLGDGGAETTNLGSISVIGGNVALTEDSATVFTGTNTIAGTLNLTSAGSITDTAGTTLNVAGATTLNAGTNAITLGEDPADTTNFGSLLTFTGGAVSLTEDSTMNVTGNASVSLALNAVGVNLAGINAPSLTVNSTGAFSGTVGIADSAASVVPGVSSFNANGFDIVLDAPGNNFGTVTLNGGTITLTNVSLVNLAGVTASGAFNLSSLGTLTISSPISSGSTANLSSTGGSLVIDAAISASSGNLSLTAAQNVTASAPGTLATAGGTVTVQAGGAAQLAGITTGGGSVTITAGSTAAFISPLTISGPFLVTAAGNSTFNAAISGGGALTVNTAGVTRFNGAISGLGSLLTNTGGSTVLAGGALGVSGSFRFNDPVTLEAATTISGPTGRFNSTLDGAQALNVILSGDAVFVGAVGGTQRLASITTDSAGRTLFYGGSVLTTGAQAYNDAVLLGTNTIFAASALTFNNTVNTGPTLASLGGLNAAATGESDLTANVSGATVFNAPVGQTSRVGDVTTDATGTTTIAANFNATKMTFRDPVIIAGGAPITINASTASTTEGISFQQGLTGAGRTIVLNAPLATISSAGDIGSATGRFSAVTAAGRNLVVGGDVWAEGDILLAIGTNGSDTSNDFLQFTVPGSVTPRTTRLDSATGSIVLGSGAVPGTTAKTAPPLRASLFKSNPGDLLLFARKITIQPFERLAVRNGSLIMIADGTAATDGITLSNTAAANYLVLASSVPNSAAAPSAIAIRSRAPANVINQSGATVPDNGTDLVAGKVLFYSAAFNSAATPMPTRTAFSPATGADFFDYANSNGNLVLGLGTLVITVLPDAAGLRSNVFVADLVTNNPTRSVQPNLAYLDLSTAPVFSNFPNAQFIDPSIFGDIPTNDLALRALVSFGAPTRNTLQQAFTPNVPRGDIAVAPPEADLAAAVREQLQALGIYARALTPAEREARDRWAAVFVTVPERARPTESDYQVADARVEDRAVREVIRFASQVGLIGESQSTLDDIARALAASYDEYSRTASSGEKTPEVLVADFRDWLLASHGPDAGKVLDYVKALRTTLQKIELLGLTRQELEGSKAQIYGSVLRTRLNIDPEFLRALVEGMPSDTLWDIKQPATQASLTPREPVAAPAID